MTVFASLPVVNNDPVNAVRDMLAQLLRANIVSAVMVAVVTHDGRSVQPALISSIEHLGKANPLLPVLPVSAARMAAFITRRFQRAENGSDGPPRIAVVMRPCEMRAAVELAKLRQITYEQLLTIGIDCVGTFETTDMQKTDDPAVCLNQVLAAAANASADAPGDLPYRHACTICPTPIAWQPDISLHTIGVDTQREILVEVKDDRLLAQLELKPGVDAAAHQKAVNSLIAVRRECRETRLNYISEQLQPHDNGMPGLLEEFESCQRCFNCTVACPICYCKECLFRSNTFAHEPDHYLNGARRKGIMRLPGDTITFQLTRLAHISTSCVGCGLCTSACPAGLPVDALFQAVARQTQSLFDYEPGRDLNELLPIATFDTDEFRNMGEPEPT